MNWASHTIRYAKCFFLKMRSYKNDDHLSLHYSVRTICLFYNFFIFIWKSTFTAIYLNYYFSMFNVVSMSIEFIILALSLSECILNKYFITLRYSLRRYWNLLRHIYWLSTFLLVICFKWGKKNMFSSVTYNTCCCVSTLREKEHFYNHISLWSTLSRLFVVGQLNKIITIQ